VINVFVQRWLALLPQPFTDADRDAGYWGETSMRQVEFARTIVFDATRHAHGFFEALIADYLDLGRPNNVEIIFNRRIRRDTPGTFRTAIDRRDNGGVLVNVFYKNSRLKQYLKPCRTAEPATMIKVGKSIAVCRFRDTSAPSPTTPKSRALTTRPPSSVATWAVTSVVSVLHPLTPTEAAVVRPASNALRRLTAVRVLGTA
jgi:hypothetical protein